MSLMGFCKFSGRRLFPCGVILPTLSSPMNSFSQYYWSCNESLILKISISFRPDVVFGPHLSFNHYDFSASFSSFSPDTFHTFDFSPTSYKKRLSYIKHISPYVLVRL